MYLKPWIIFFICALVVSLLVGASAFMFAVSPRDALLLIPITFFITITIIGIFFRFFFSDQVSNVLKSVDVLKENQVDLSQVNPLRALQVASKELSSYAMDKEREIRDLKEMANFRREFIADVSHELKTPIFAAQGFIHTLLDGASEDETVRKRFLKKAAKSLDGLDLLVQDLLSLSQIETGQRTVQLGDFNLWELFIEIIDQFEDKSEKKNIKLYFLPDKTDKVIVSADEKLIYQVISNLLSNAIKYTQEKGEITVGYETSNFSVRIFIKDNGPGIPKEDQNRIFERFYRVEKSRSREREKGGTGLGLAIVKHILEAHHSKIGLKSQLGKGSEFFFDLPLVK
jgi:two-component system phosphate regulon sensor histidine kinase PhoR